MAMFSQIRYEVDGPAAVITLDRPDHMNAFTGTMLTELLQAFDRADADDAVRAVIVTGEGRAFCAGADLSSGGDTFDLEARGVPAAEARAPRDGGGVLVLRIFESTKPVIGAINGSAVGVGISMTLPMDIRSSPTTPRSASSSPGGASLRMARRAGSCRGSSASTRRWSGSSRPACSTPRRRSTAASCAASTLLTRCWRWPGPRRGDRRQRRAGVGGRQSGLAVADAGRGHPMDAHRADSEAIFDLGRKADAREGVMAFLEKRPPSWHLSPTHDLPATYPWWDNPTYEGE